MKNRISTIVAIVVFFGISWAGCMAQSPNTLSPAAFGLKIKETKQPLVLDVRTPEEYAGGHIDGAVNIDWYNDNFGTETAKLDKNRPLFVYCHSGKRSSAAAEKLRKDGWKEVYELAGGYSAWGH
jgi:rhodanese-related sulfurtransferase